MWWVSDLSLFLSLAVTFFWPSLSSLFSVHTLSAHLGEVTSVTFSSDGRHLLSASKDNSNRLWDVRMGRTLRRYKGHQNITRNLCKASFAACDSVVYSGRSVIFRLLGHEETRSFTHGLAVARRLPNFQFCIVVPCSEDGCAWAWDSETGETLRGRGGRLVGHKAMVYSTVWSQPQAMLATCSEDTTVRTWWCR